MVEYITVILIRNYGTHNIGKWLGRPGNTIVNYNKVYTVYYNVKMCGKYYSKL